MNLNFAYNGILIQWDFVCPNMKKNIVSFICAHFLSYTKRNSSVSIVFMLNFKSFRPLVLIFTAFDTTNFIYKVIIIKDTI